MWIILFFAIAALCGRVQGANAEGSVKSQQAEDEEGRPRRLIPIYYTPGNNNYDSLLHDEYLRQQEQHLSQQQLDQHQQRQERKGYNMVASGYSYSNGDSQQFFKQYLPESASSFQTPTYLKYVHVTDNSSPKPHPVPASLPKFKPIQPPSPTDYYLTTPASLPNNNQYVVLNDNIQYYYPPAHDVQSQQPIYKYLHVQSTPTPQYNLVSTAQPQQYQNPGNQVQYQQNTDQAQYQTNTNQQYHDNNQAHYQETANQAQYQDNSHEQHYEDSSNQPLYQDTNQHFQDNANSYQQYILDSAKQQDYNPERQYLPLQDKLVSPVQYQGQTQYQSPVAGQYQAETYPTTNEPLGSHRFAPTTQTTLDAPKATNSNDPRLSPKVTSVTIQKSQELPLKSSYAENDDSQREQSFSYPTKPTKLQKVRPNNKPNYDVSAHTTESYYPYEHLQPFVENIQYANQQSKPTPFHHTQPTITSARPYYVSSTTPLYPSTSFVSSATPSPVQNVKIVSNSDEEHGGKSPFDFLKNFQLGKDQNYEIPLTSFTGPAKENSYSTTKKPQTSHTKASSFYDPYLKLIKTSSNKINPANFFKTQRPRPQQEVTVPTEKSILPPHEEQKYREHIGALTQILKGHQIDKALPEKVTADNIDASIDTLTTILKVLQKNPGGFPVPPAPATPVKHQHFPYTGSLDNSLTLKTQTYTDGSTPGRPGIDYPTLTDIPETKFDCKTQRYKGFFGDPETHCQVWHYCDLNGGQASFLCPNGTIFSQQALTCDWWFNVRCNSTAQLYVLNERLYKFILPTKPSFPEDYAGPEVDEYLTQKFYESEAKRKPSGDNETTVLPGTTTEPVQSNDLSDNYLRRDVATQLRDSKDTAADRIDTFVESRNVSLDPRYTSIARRDKNTKPRDSFLKDISGTTRDFTEERSYISLDPNYIAESDISTHPRNVFLQRRDVSKELRDISPGDRDISTQLQDISFSQHRDISTRLHTWR